VTKAFRDLPPLGQFVRYRTTELGLRQGTVAKLAGISEKHMSAVVTGQSGLSPYCAVSLGRALEVSPVLLVMLERVHQIDLVMRAGGGG
jgi:plasmid maintenance system antidote protein VapI